jgi:hypothetical protein
LIDWAWDALLSPPWSLVSLWMLFDDASSGRFLDVVVILLLPLGCCLRLWIALGELCCVLFGGVQRLQLARRHRAFAVRLSLFLTFLCPFVSWTHQGTQECVQCVSYHLLRSNYLIPKNPTQILFTQNFK